ncbi:putative glycosyltransferase EpsE [Stieleria varia]|uniref:Putative glycosyltransferase EpsE n=2 Tax=Stieleria varia TaxID=2528005 RepID=A0A5C6B3B7_9BACT|nr:putative glycosyltransferase EpsE [Stieleria varia]
MSCYNNESCVSRAVDSILNQTFSRWELIVVNDGSTDATGEILDAYADRDSRIRVIHQANTGLTKALIAGCSVAKTDVIARQDADDVSRPRRLESQIALLDQDASLGFVSCFAEYVGPQGEFLSQTSRPTDPDEATKQLLHDRIGPPAHGTVMFRKPIYEKVGEYRHQFYCGQDADLWLRLAEVSKIGYVPEVLYQVQIDSVGITGSGRQVQQRFGVFGRECHQARISGEDETPILAKAAKLSADLRQERDERRHSEPTRSQQRSRVLNQSNTNYMIGSQLIKNRDARGRAYLWQVIRHRPHHWRAWARLAQSSLFVFSGANAERDACARGGQGQDA